jgi:murein DD-endopeptidase MepM/ murein hydrolase activator NlpD
MTANSDGLPLSVQVLSGETPSAAALVYRNMSDAALCREAAGVRSGWADAVLPGAATAPAGFEYRFEVTLGGKTYCTPNYAVSTEWDPVSLGWQGSTLLPSPVTVMSQSRIAWDIDAKNGSMPNGTYITANSGRSPIRDANKNDLYPAVTSKMFELRTTGSSPHTGIDLGVAEKTSVYPIASGVIEFVNDPTTPTSPSAGRYVRVKHASGAYYSHYYHLHSIGISPVTGQKWKKDDSIGVNDVVGLSGDTGSPGAYHLDFGIETYDGGVKVYVPAKWFYSGRTQWNYARDLDYAGTPSLFTNTSGTGIQIRVYPKGTTDGSGSTVTLYIRTGTNPFTERAMTHDSADYGRFYAYVNDFKGQSVQYYIKVWRTNIPGKGSITRPAMYHETDNTAPNNPGLYWSATP